MKISAIEGKSLETNASSGNSLEFGIGDPSVVIEILRNRLYSNPIQTLVQEYISNARDSHREAGKSAQQIEVGLPSLESPKFFVRDFGSGISPDRIKDIFVNYGSSTKRHTNSQTGGFGIGAKSAWAYTDSFVVKTVFSKVERHYVAHIGTKTNGVLELVFEQSTEKENQTTIEIAVKSNDVESFVNAALRSTIFWEVRPKFFGSGSIFKEWTAEVGYYSGPAWYTGLNREYEVCGVEFYKEKSLNGFFRSGSYWDTGAVIVVDGIPYYLDSAVTGDFFRIKSLLNNEGNVLVFRVGNGDCEVSASREKISDSDASKKGLGNIFKKYESDIRKELDIKLAQIKSLDEFKDFIRERENFYSGDYLSKITFNGWTISGSFIFNKEYSEKNNIEFINCFNKEQRVRGGIGVKNQKKVILKQDLYTISRGIPLSCDKFYFLDKEFSNSEIKEKIRQILPEETRDSIVIFKSISDLSVEVSAKPLSSIESPKKEKTYRKKGIQSVEKNVSMRIFSGDYRYDPRRSIFSVKKPISQISNESGKFVYLEKDKVDEKNFCDIAHDLRRFDIKFCFVSGRELLKVKKLSNFISFDEFKDRFKDIVPISIQELICVEKVESVFYPFDDKVLGIIFKEKERDFFSSIRRELDLLSPIFTNKFFSKNHSNYTSWVGRLGLTESVFGLKDSENSAKKVIEFFKTNYPLLFAINNPDENLDLDKELNYYLKSKNS